MNAKFEKWCEDYALDVQPLTAESRRADCQAAYKAGSKDGIQSLEVTFELKDILGDVIADQIGAYANEDDCEVILRAIISALKEQAK